jgi:hypothetical protein
MCNAVWIVERESINIGGEIYVKQRPVICRSVFNPENLIRLDCQGRALHEGAHFADIIWEGRCIYVQWNDAPAWTKGMEKKIAHDTFYRR